MKAIINGKIILKDRIVEDGVLLYSDVIEGVVKNDQIPEGVYRFVYFVRVCYESLGSCL